MKGIVLAGGYAKRLWPLTVDTPKPLLPIGDGFIIDYIVAKLRALDLEEIIISTNKRFEEKFVEWIKKRGYAEIRVIPEPSKSEEEKLGPIRALQLIIGESGPDDYFITAGDNLFSLDLRCMLDFYNQVSSAVIALYEVERKEDAKKYACVIVDDENLIRRFEEKPESPPCCLVSTGIYALPWRCISRIGEYLAGGNPPDPMGRFICWLSETEKVYGLRFSGYWYDIGSIESYRAAFETFKGVGYSSYR
ncbi:MAG: nucleotidyltransferase family protein [Candidatus Verstraetearchaeota archaeon]|nr:nucleotidyltransferase family protein [Candidatus Verstraetearchaeota archaeon]